MTFCDIVVILIYKCVIYSQQNKIKNTINNICETDLYNKGNVILIKSYFINILFMWLFCFLTNDEYPPKIIFYEKINNHTNAVVVVVEDIFVFHKILYYFTCWIFYLFICCYNGNMLTYNTHIT